MTTLELIEHLRTEPARHADGHRWLTGALRERLAAVERTVPTILSPEGPSSVRKGLSNDDT